MTLSIPSSTDESPQTDLTGKTILITGATDGLGKTAAGMLAERGAHLILHGRSPEKLAAVVSEIQAACPEAKIDQVLADFSSMREVRRMAEEILAKYARLDVLVNNAGIFCTRQAKSEDGFELTFAVNYLASFLLTQLLRPLLLASSLARVVNMSSLASKLVGYNPKRLPGKNIFWGWVAYSRSKLLMAAFSNALARRMEGTGVTSNALHPGVILGTSVTRAMWSPSAISREAGAQSIVNLVANPALADVSGAYFSQLNLDKPNPAANNVRKQDALWAKSLVWCGLEPEN